MKTGVMILAAGGSSRMGQPKQLLPAGGHGETLIHRSAATALALEIGPVMVVLGAAAEACRKNLADLTVDCTVNPRWEEGMGGSIAWGIEAMSGMELESVLLMLCDQPGLTTERLRSLYERHLAGGAVVTAARYGGSLGTPAIFDRVLFPELQGLEGTQGAKRIILAQQDAQSFEMVEAAFDLDSPGDYHEWMCRSLSTGVRQ